MNRYFLYWLDGKVQMLLSEGSIIEASQEAGICSDAVPAIDFYNEDFPSKHIFVKTSGRGEWVPMGTRMFRSLDEIEQAGKDHFDSMANECQSLIFTLPSGDLVTLELRIRFTEAEIFRLSYTVNYDQIGPKGFSTGCVCAFVDNFNKAFHVFKNLANCSNLKEAARATERNAEDYESALDKLIAEWNEQIRIYKLNRS